MRVAKAFFAICARATQAALHGETGCLDRMLGVEKVQRRTTLGVATATNWLYLERGAIQSVVIALRLAATISASELDWQGKISTFNRSRNLDICESPPFRRFQPAVVTQRGAQCVVRLLAPSAQEVRPSCLGRSPGDLLALPGRHRQGAGQAALGLDVPADAVVGHCCRISQGSDACK